MLETPVYDFFTNLNEFYGCIAETCTATSCPTMSAGPSYVISTHSTFISDSDGVLLPPVGVFRSHSIHLLIPIVRLNYLWTTREGKQVSLPAPTYIDYVISSVQQLLEDENVFPNNASTCFSYVVIVRLVYIPNASLTDHSFHPTFPSTVKTVYRQLLRVFAHLYHAHFATILHLRCVSGFLTSFMFAIFCESALVNIDP